MSAVLNWPKADEPILYEVEVYGILSTVKAQKESDILTCVAQGWI